MAYPPQLRPYSSHWLDPRTPAGQLTFCWILALSGCAAVLAYLMLDHELAWAIHAWGSNSRTAAAHWTDLVQGGRIAIALSAVGLYGWLAAKPRMVYWAVLTGLAVLASGTIINVLKLAIGRMRPTELFEHGASGFIPFSWRWKYNSMPSGHSASAGSLWLMLALIPPRSLPAGLWALCLVVPAFAITSTRMLTWSHFLSDCIAGFAIGVLSAMLVFAVARSKGFWWESGPGAASPSPTVQSPPGERARSGQRCSGLDTQRLRRDRNLQPPSEAACGCMRVCSSSERRPT